MKICDTVEIPPKTQNQSHFGGSMILEEMMIPGEQAAAKTRAEELKLENQRKAENAQGGSFLVAIHGGMLGI